MMMTRYRLILFLLIIYAVPNLMADSPQALYNEGVKAFAEKKYAEALDLFKKVIAKHPDVAAPYYGIGKSYIQQEEYNLAEPYLKKALALDPKSIELYQLLGFIFLKQKDYTQSETNFRKLLELYPDNLDALFNLGFTLKKQGKITEAIPYFNKVIEINPDHTRAHYQLGRAYLATGNFKKGIREWIIASPGRFHNHHITLEELRNKRVLLSARWGLGDFIQFIRYAKILKEQYNVTLIVQTYKSLFPLFKRCNYIDTLIEIDQKRPEYDIRISFFSLLSIFDTTHDTIPADIPYLYPDPQLVSFWKQKLSPDKKFKVGICSLAGQKDRTIPLALLSTLFEIKHISFYLLEKNQTDSVTEKFPIHTFGKAFDKTNGSFMDTAAIIKNLDLVITVDTSVCHLAGALGANVWTILPHPAEFRWLIDKSVTPWYPTMRLFRQKQQGDWLSVIKEVKKELLKIVQASQTMHPYYTIGLSHIKSKQYNLAECYLKKALELKPTYINNYLALGLAYNKKNEHKKAEAISKKLLEIEPHNPDGLFNVGVSLNRRGKRKEAIEYFKQVLEIKPTFHSAHYEIAQSYLGLGNFEKGWPHYEWRIYNRKLHCHHINSNDLENKTVMLRFEPWGLGDFIQFIRYAKCLKQLNTKVIVETYKPLVTLLRQCDYIDQVVAKGQAAPAYDIGIPFLSLPLIFKTNQETIPADIPYISANPKLVDYWKQKLSNDKNIKVGLCWKAGNPERTIPVELFSTLSEIKNVSFYCLQKNQIIDQELPEEFVIHTFGKHFDETNGSFMDTAALIKNVDLVITADTSVCHLAGALGAKVWTIIPDPAEWRWLEHTSKTAWYPNMRLFRQQKPGDWRSAIETVKKELLKIVQKSESLHKSPNERYKQGLNEFNNKNYQTAIDHFKAVITQNPQLMMPYYTIGKSYIQLKQYTLAQSYLKKAIELNPRHIENYLDLGFTFAQQRKYEEAEDVMRCLLTAHPDNLDGLYNLGYALGKQNKREEAITYYKKALEIKPDHVEAHFGLAKSYLAVGDFENGWNHFEWRFHNDSLRKKYACHTIDPEDLRGKTVFLRFEPWGLGDYMHFIRYAKCIKNLDAKVIIETSKVLVSLMKQCDYIDAVITKGQVPPQFDIQIPYLSLPLIFKTRHDTIPADIPYLFADPKLVTFWQSILQKDKQFKVGICCEAGYPTRAIPIELFASLAQIEGIRFYCLQKPQIKPNELPKNFSMYTFGEEFDTKHGPFMDTAAVIKNLDLVITTDTSVCHLAGALGASVWTILPYFSEFRWMQATSTTPWYPNMRLFRQKKNGDWSSAIKEIKEELIKITSQSGPKGEKL